MKITYVHHSSFLVETESCYLLFDYIQGELPKLKENKPLFVLVSHRHGDHFSPVIFDLIKEYPSTRYIVSDDIWQNRTPHELYSKIEFIGPQDEMEDGPIRIETYKSTDEGVAFLITCGKEVIYHAGDLNNWMWQGESKQFNDQMSSRYRLEIEKMAGRKIDVAFLPLDSRQEDWFYYGLDDFMTKVGAEIVFPMHFWDKFEVIEKFKKLPCAKEYKDRIREIHKEGETFTV